MSALRSSQSAAMYVAELWNLAEQWKAPFLVISSMTSDITCFRHHIVVLKYMEQNIQVCISTHTACGGVVKCKYKSHDRHTVPLTHPTLTHVVQKIVRGKLDKSSALVLRVWISSTTRPENATFKSCRRSLRCYLILLFSK